MNLLDILLANWPLVLLLILLIVGKNIANSPHVKGWFGEKLVLHTALKKLDPVKYSIFNDVYLPRPDGAGTTQIDHIVISTYGIFVIETKNYQHWIFGSEKQKQWTQQHYKSKKRFQNPIHQNELHIKALMAFTDLPRDRFYTVIAFVGDCVLKTNLPDYVLTNGIASYIKSKRHPLLSQEQAHSIIANLETELANQDKPTLAKAHKAFLTDRHK